MRRCWTCNTDHDLDEPCSQSRTVRSVVAAGGSASQLFTNGKEEFGPVFCAGHESECESCDEGIVPGEDIRADGRGGWIHADAMCEKVARG